jgi:hypothetical protein
MMYTSVDRRRRAPDTAVLDQVEPHGSLALGQFVAGARHPMDASARGVCLQRRVEPRATRVHVRDETSPVLTAPTGAGEITVVLVVGHARIVMGAKLTGCAPVAQARMWTANVSHQLWMGSLSLHATGRPFVGHYRGRGKLYV